jgi:hypothetical protein
VYVPANAGVVAQVVRNDPAIGNTVRFIHPDLLASPDVVTTETADTSGQLQDSVVIEVDTNRSVNGDPHWLSQRRDAHQILSTLASASLVRNRMKPWP